MTNEAIPVSNTNDDARVLCPRTCLDCCCQEHHWGDYSNDLDESGEEDDNCMGCKHCPALLDYVEKCTVCGKELIDHDLDTLACDPEDETPMPATFRYKGQPDRVCNQVHPWDEPGIKDDHHCVSPNCCPPKGN